MTLKPLLAVAIFAIAQSALSQQFEISGTIKTCSQIQELDAALDEPSINFFSTWTSQDFEAANGWASTCQASKYKEVSGNRAAFLKFVSAWVDERRQTKTIRDQAETDRQRVNAYIDLSNKIRKEKEAAERERQQEMAAKLDACEHSDAYQPYNYQERVITDLDLIQSAREQQKQERRISAASGVRNLWNERANGEALVQSQDDLKSDFAEYKRLGGKARSPEAVKHTIANPCEFLQ